MFTALLSLIPNLIGIGADWLKGKRELKAAKVEGQLAVTNAITMSNIKLAETGQLAEIDWSLSMAKASAGKTNGSPLYCPFRPSWPSFQVCLLMSNLGSSPYPLHLSGINLRY